MSKTWHNVNRVYQQALVAGLQHGFQVFSPDGASWQPIIVDTFSIGWPTRFDLIPFMVNYFSVTGSGADSLLVGAVRMVGPGLEAGFNGDCWYIPTMVYAADVGGTICLDSAWTPPAGQWLWALGDGSQIMPAWAGPYCYTIVADQQDWDNHKMHYPQLPDEAGWDVNATNPIVLADDWQCSQTGWVKDIHFWGSWMHGDEGQIISFNLSIHEDIPADPPLVPYSRPGITVWEREIIDFAATPKDPPSWEGWYDPMTGMFFENDHQAYFQYDVILDSLDWFPQDEGTIYWLNISATVVDPFTTQWGWKSTLDHWNDDAVWAEWGLLDWIDMFEPPEYLQSLDLAFVITGEAGQIEPDSCDYYKPAYGDYAPFGMPDFDQKQDLWIYPPSGMWSYCGPVALANCLWWFDSKFEPSPVVPTPFYPGPGNPPANDGYNLVYPFGAAGGWDDHDTNNVMPFVDSMALYCMTNSSGSGTNVFDLAQGALDWMDSVGLGGKYTVNVLPVDPAFGFDQIRDEVLISQDVILLLGFWEDVGGGYCERIGGHFVTVAGTCTDPLDSALCISDPYFDMHEGEPPAGSAHGSSVHNDAANISGPHGTMYHDKYRVSPNTCQQFAPPFFDCELPGYPVNAGNVAVWYGQNNPDPSIDPMPPQGGPIHTIIEYAVVICPDTTEDPTGACCEPPYGLCHIMTQFSCDSAGWFYEGDGATCTPNPCDSCDYQNPGDFNDDGSYTITDLTSLITYLYSNGAAPSVPANADPNGDCCVDYNDIWYLIQYLFYGGPAPVNCTCVDPPICLPAPPPHTPGLVRHNTNSYVPPDGSPLNSTWHELWPDYCEDWTVTSVIDNGDGILSWCDTLEFTHDVHGGTSLEHVEVVTPTLTLLKFPDLIDTVYIDLLDPPNPLINPITDAIGTFWHEVHPNYCRKYVIAYWQEFNTGSLQTGHTIKLQALNGPDSSLTADYWVAAIETDIITTPIVTVRDEYDHNTDGYSPYDGTPVGTSWQELWPNYNDMWTVEEWIDNGDGWLSFCDTIKVVGQLLPYPVVWKHVKEVTTTFTLVDTLTSTTYYFDYLMVNPMHDWSSNPVGTFYHEVYPDFCLRSVCVGWVDNGSGWVDSCDYLTFEFIDGVDSGTTIELHLVDVAADIATSIEEHWDPPPPMDGKFKHNIDGWKPSDGSPVGSLWHELWFNYCEMWTCSLWIDNGNTVLDYCDTLVFQHEPTGRLSYEHVQVVTPTITVTNGDSTWYLDGMDPNPLIDNITHPIGGYWQLAWPRTSWFGYPYLITNWIDNGNGFLDSCDYIDFRNDWGEVHVGWHVIAVETDIITDPLPNPNIDEYDHNIDGYLPADGDPTGTMWHELRPNYCDLWHLDEWRDNGDGILSFCDTLKFRGEVGEVIDSILWKHVEEVTGTVVLVPVEGGDTVYMDYMCGRPTAEPLTFVENPLGTFFHEVHPTFCRRYIWQGWGENGSQVLDAGDGMTMRSINPTDSGTLYWYTVVDWQTDIMTTIIESPSCCVPPIRGNMDMDPLDQIDISDLVYIVDYMFTGGPAPMCWAEANIDCSDSPPPGDGPEDIDISDFVYLVDYMFNGGPAPCRCDCADCP